MSFNFQKNKNHKDKSSIEDKKRKDLATYEKEQFLSLQSTFFIGATQTVDKVFFFFREEAIEASGDDKVIKVADEI